MSRLLYVTFLQVLVVSTIGQSVTRSRPANFPKQPVAMVEGLYQHVVARHALGIPTGENWALFAPYLSKGLFQRIETDRSCQFDWVRQNQGRVEKEPFAWGETGLFSGDEDLSEPSKFQIDRTERNRDGSVDVYLKLSRSAPREKPWNWDVAVRVVMEKGYPVVDDIVYLKGEEVHAEYRLSEILAQGCDGPRWVGYGKQHSQSE